METALANGIDGIIGECGGFAMCATCHVYVESLDTALPPIEEAENHMLESTAEVRRPNSRLSCQIISGSHLDGLVLRLPERQYD
jgi:2Fe-2S ferredoxin